jgi:hypothetical protein
MSRHGRIIAEQYGSDLPVFENVNEAEEVLLELRTSGLRALEEIEELSGKIDYTPESLKLLERWYFANGKPAATKTGYSMPHAIGFYFGEILNRNSGFSWVVNEFAFKKRRYEVGVQRGRVSIMLTKGKKLQEAGNAQMQSLFREWKKYTINRKS